MDPDNRATPKLKQRLKQLEVFFKFIIRVIQK